MLFLSKFLVLVCARPRGGGGILLFPVLVMDASTLPVFNEPVPNFVHNSAFICFGAHQYPNSNMSNVLTQYLTLVGTLLHNTFSDSTARSRMGSEKQKGGGGGGATSKDEMENFNINVYYSCIG